MKCPGKSRLVLRVLGSLKCCTPQNLNPLPPILEALDIPPNIRTSIHFRSGSISLPSLWALAYNLSHRVPIPREHNSPLNEAMEENKVVHERNLEDIAPTREFNLAKFCEFDEHRSAVPSKLFIMIYLVDAVGIEPTTCRLRGESRSPESQ